MGHVDGLANTDPADCRIGKPDPAAAGDRRHRLHYVAWFGPLIVAVIAKVMLDRKYKPVQPEQATHAAAIQYLF